MQIVKGDTSPCKLVSSTGTVLAEGTHTHCANVKREIEDERNAKTLGTDEQGY